MRPSELSPKANAVTRLLMDWKAGSKEALDSLTPIVYDELCLETDPSLRPMFRGDIEEQGRKLMQIIGVAVGSLRQREKVRPAVEEMGRRHAGYGVRDDYYGTVAGALLWTLEQGLGRENFTDEVRDAWIAMYAMVSEAMQRGAAVAVAVAV